MIVSIVGVRWIRNFYLLAIYPNHVLFVLAKKVTILGCRAFPLQRVLGVCENIDGTCKKIRFYQMYVFTNFTDPLGSTCTEIDRQSLSQFYASLFDCMVSYRTIVRYRKQAGKYGTKNLKKNSYFTSSTDVVVFYLTFLFFGVSLYCTVLTCQKISIL